MRDFGKLGTRIWKSQKFRRLGEDWFAKTVYMYLHCSPHTNSSGCFDLPVDYAIADVRCSETDFATALHTLCAVGLIEWDDRDETVLITNWWAFNVPSNAKHALGCAKVLQQASSARLKAIQARELGNSLRNWDDEAVMRGLRAILAKMQNGYDTLSKHRERERDGEREEKRDEIETANLFEPRESPATPRKSVTGAPAQTDHPLNALLDRRLGKVR